VNLLKIIPIATTIRMIGIQGMFIEIMFKSLKSQIIAKAKIITAKVGN
jgi:hypothetical protein